MTRGALKGGGRCQEWVDQRHPKIVGMMTEYVAARGMRIQLTEILDATNKHIIDLLQLELILR